MILAALALAATPLTARVDAVATGANLAGVVLVAKGDTVLLEQGYGVIEPGGTKRHDPKARWRLASITKQVTATTLVRDHFAALDQPVSSLKPGVTLRQLLTHHSGLANPDATPVVADGFPAFYRAGKTDVAYCRSKPPVPGSDFSYNNCDYIVAAADLGTPRWPAGMAMARAGDNGLPGYIAGKIEPTFQLTTFGASGGLIGTARSVFDFDRGLMTGKLVSPAQRDALWTAEGGRSYQALGQWVFPGQLKGCASPKRIVQRDGEIGGVQTRNFILPDDDLVVIVFTNRSTDDFKFGEIWQGSGFAYDLLSTVACG